MYTIEGLTKIKHSVIAISFLFLHLEAYSQADNVQEEFLMGRFEASKEVFKLILPRKEFDIFDKIQVRFSPDSRKNEFTISKVDSHYVLNVSQGYITSIFMAGTLLAANNIQSLQRKNLQVFYELYYECLQLYKSDAIEFAALDSSEWVEVLNTITSVDGINFFQTSFNFRLLHELFHILQGNLLDANSFNETDADLWAIDKIYSIGKYFKNPEYVTYNTTVNAIHHSLELAHFMNDSKLKYNDIDISERRYQIDLYLKGLCGTFRNFICNTIDSTINYDKEAIRIQLNRRILITKLQNAYEGNYYRIKDSIRYKLNGLYQATGHKISEGRFNLYNGIGFLFMNDDVDSLSTIERLPILTDCYLKGTWNVKPDVNKALLLNELLANLDQSSLEGAILRSADKEMYSQTVERAAIVCSLIYLYRFNDYSKAIYYLRIAALQHKILSPLFYSKKIALCEEQLNKRSR